MKKTTLNRAIVAGLAGVAGFAGVTQAVNLNPEGTGSTLIYPYYTVRAGQDTLLTVINTTNDTKLVKVRWREGKESADVRDFNIFLSPFDVWVSAVTENAAGDGGHVDVPDNTCSSPNLANFGGGVDFTNLDYAGDIADTDAWTVDNGTLDRTKEGYFTAIEMGVLDPLDPGAAILIASVKHIAGVPSFCDAGDNAYFQINDSANPNEVPAGGNALQTLWSGTNGFDQGVLAPGGGLFGSAYVIDVVNGTLATYNARAVQNMFSASANAQPSSAIPALTSGTSLTANVFDPALGRTVDATFLNGTNAISATLMRDTVMNEYTAEANIGALTDWVVTFPTKNGHVTDLGRDINGNPLGTATQPFNNFHQGQNANGGCIAGEEFGEVFYDREEGIFAVQRSAIPPNTPVFSPPPGAVAPGQLIQPEFCFEANVLEFAPTGFLASDNEVNVNGSLLAASANGFTAGWSRVVFKDDVLDSVDVANFGAAIQSDNAGVADVIDGHSMSGTSTDPMATTGNITLDGLPVVGMAIEALRSSNAGTNYAGAFDHRYSRNITLS